MFLKRVWFRNRNMLLPRSLGVCMANEGAQRSLNQSQVGNKSAVVGQNSEELEKDRAGELTAQTLLRNIRIP